MTNDKCQNNIKVEWHSGRELHTYPKRVKINGVWHDIFTCEKIVHEDVLTKKRETIFRCHIGDNRIVEIVGK